MAEEHKKSFMLYFDNFPCVAALDAEQRGELLLALFEYARAAAQGHPEPEETMAGHPIMTPETRMAFAFLAQTIHRDTEQWLRKQARCSRAARERAEERLKQKLSVRDYYNSKAALARAMARLKEAGKYEIR